MRSSRRRSNSTSPTDVAKEWIQKGEDPPGFVIIYNEKGRGVATTVLQRRGSFLFQYAGEILTKEEGNRREDLGSSGYRFFFNQYCIDATKETERLGRLVNHGEKKERNCAMKVVGGHLCLFCIRDIEIGEELLYDYGERNLPWKKKKQTKNSDGKKNQSENELAALSESEAVAENEGTLKNTKRIRKRRIDGKKNRSGNEFEAEAVPENEGILENTSVKRKRRLELPSAPRNLMTKDLTPASVTLDWQPPSEDGGLPIKCYVIERRNKKSGSWVKEQTVKGPATSCVIEGLREGVEYFFRVTAETEEGASPGVENKDAVKVRNAATAPDMPIGPIKFISVSETSVAFEWKAPSKNGGSPLTCYKVEMVSKDLSWTEIQSTEATSTMAKVRDLNTDQWYTFRVSAVNQVGVSKALESTKVMPTKQLGPPESPIAPLVASPLSRESVKLAWSVPASDGGSPITAYLIEKRDVTRSGWSHADLVTKQDAVIKGLKEGSEFFFRVFAVNKIGQSEPLEMTKPICIKSPFDVPSAPRPPLEVSDVTENSANFSWKAPEDDGGLPISHYIVEIRESRHSMWGKADEVEAKYTKYTCKNLVTDNEYYFRVKAVNAKGESPALDGKEAVKPKKIIGVPSAPVSVSVGRIGEGNITIQWSAPKNDGGSRIKKYHTNFRSDEPGSAWMEAGIVETFRSHYTFPKLSHEKRYLFAVAAENEAGLGEKGLTDKSVAPKQPMTAPSAPEGPIEISDIQETSFVLSWKPSKDDGGSPIQHYAVEKRGSKETGWTYVDHVKPNSTKYQMVHLMKGSSYHVRVKAENKIGQSEPLENDDIITPKSPFNPQSKPLLEGTEYMAENDEGLSQPLESKEPVSPQKAPVKPAAPGGVLRASSLTQNSVTLNWLAPSDDGGLPLKHYIIEAYDSETKNWATVADVPANTTQKTITGLQEGLQYEFRVLAENTMGRSKPNTLDQSIVPSRLADGKKNQSENELAALSESEAVAENEGTLKNTKRIRKRRIGIDPEYDPSLSDSDISISEVVDPDYKPASDSESFISEDGKKNQSENELAALSESEAVAENEGTLKNTKRIQKRRIGIDPEYDPSLSDSDISISEVVDPDYKPASDSESFISEDCENQEDHKVSDSEENNSGDESVIFPMLEKKKIYFQGVQKNLKGNIKNKVHACFYCENIYANIARHLELSHKNEVEVAKILMYPKRSKERRKMWEKIVNKGDFAHNIDVIDKGDGMLIPKKRTDDPSSDNLIPCQYCKAFYNKIEIWKHSKYCVAKGKDESIKNPVKNGRMLLPTKNCSDLAKNVLNIMRDDEIRLIIQSDHRILDFGHRLYEKHGQEVHKIHYISQKLRELGRLLVECKKLSKDVSCIDDLLKTKNWDLLIKSVKTVAGYDSSTHSYATPSLALKIGHSLQKCARYLRSEGSKQDDLDKVGRAESFLKLYEGDWNDDVSGHALSSLGDRKYNKPLLLPIVKDVVKLNNYLTREVNVICKNIEEQFESSMYSRLAQMCLAMVILFNRRRSGEVERMTIKAFLDADKNTSGKPDAVVLSTLNEFEKNLCKTHTRIEIKGKRGRKVAVLLTNKLKENIEVLISQRDKANVTKDLLFSKPGDSKFPYRGSDCLRKFSLEAGVENPNAITSTKLRKQLATLAQILNLSETSQDILATFQGHDIRVHREFYRLPEDTMQIAKVTKVLHSINDGSIAKYEGKDFDEIQLAEKEALQSESEISEGETESENEQIFATTERETEEAEEEFEETSAKKCKKPRTVPKARHQWTKEEKNAIRRQFKKEIVTEKTPGQLQCLNAIRLEPCLRKFEWRQVKFAVKNVITTCIRQAKKQEKKT